MYQVTINGKQHQVDVDGDTPLLWVIRDELDLTGTKFGCGISACGACTVLVDGVPERSCQIPIEDARDMSITTIEAVSGKVAQAVQDAWREKDVVQCGYCQSGQIVQAIGLLKENSAPTDSEIDAYMSGNACRCATYHRIRAAIHVAAQKLEG
ncbi:MAG: isoquinoline 1-oxidoreductase [Alphaproteobacteria bacterium]|nr:MAG: isoquinoline 1-oxidoreductase [Alphaproteobacteria bacterium]